MTPFPLKAYAVAAAALEPLARMGLGMRAGKGKEDPARLGERLGRPGVARQPGPLAWLHGVSVGESLSLLPLAQALARARPDLTVLVTTGTVTAASLIAARLPAGAIHQYAPIDTPAAARRFLDHWRPAVAVFVESEIWPNLIRTAKARGVRLALVSARITERSARGWGRAPASARALFSAFDLVLAQDGASEARLTALGARCGPRCNLKHAAPPLSFDPRAVQAFEDACEGRVTVLAISTHPGEEALIARAFQRACKVSALLVAAPRHPDRGPDVARELTALGMTVARRGAGEAITPQVDAFVLDTLGELGLYLAAADIAVMGGGFADGVGGHNPLEPARHGLPILTGPRVANAAETYAELFAEAAAIEAADEADLARHLAGLLAYPQLGRRIGAAARRYAARRAGELDRALALLLPLAAS